MYSLTLCILKTMLGEHKALLRGEVWERRLFMSVCKNENKNSYIFSEMTANKPSFFLQE